jgi:hypothetical protein
VGKAGAAAGGGNYQAGKIIWLGGRREEIKAHAFPPFETLSWRCRIYLGNFCLRSFRELVNGISGSARTRGAANFLRPNVGLLASNGGWGICIDWMLLFDSYDLAEEILSHYSVVWRSHVN